MCVDLQDVDLFVGPFTVLLSAEAFMRKGIKWRKGTTAMHK